MSDNTQISKDDEKPTLESGLVQFSLNWKTEIALISLLVVTSMLFLFFPGIDNWFSSFFYKEPEEDEFGFWAREEPLLNLIRSIGPLLVQIAVASSILLIVIFLINLSRRKFYLLQSPMFLLTSLMLGPGLIVSIILKDNWGRPRPWMTEYFGGDFPYVPVWKITEFCDKNCSFVSGEASVVVWLISVAFIVPLAWRRTIAIAILIVAVLLSLNRIAFGGHFLSDVVLSWEITLLVVRLVFRLIYEKIPKYLAND